MVKQCKSTNHTLWTPCTWQWRTETRKMSHYYFSHI